MTSRVLLVVIDAATPHVVCPAIQTGRLPTMQRLAEIGDMHQASATIGGGAPWQRAGVGPRAPLKL